MCSCHIGTVVGRAIVDHDQLELLSERLTPDGRQTPVEPSCSVKGAEDDADAESLSIG
jgi:hypothetical protein